MRPRHASPREQPMGNMVQGLIIVARDHPDVLESLTQHFVGSEDVRVVLDQRRGERRRRVKTVRRERRSADRRRPASTENDLRSRPFVITGPRH